MQIDAKLMFEPRDCWVGVYWDRPWPSGFTSKATVKLYICVVPMLVIRLRVWWHDKKWTRGGE